jgi:hypothetical protein
VINVTTTGSKCNRIIYSECSIYYMYGRTISCWEQIRFLLSFKRKKIDKNMTTRISAKYIPDNNDSNNIDNNDDTNCNHCHCCNNKNDDNTTIQSIINNNHSNNNFCLSNSNNCCCTTYDCCSFHNNCMNESKIKVDTTAKEIATILYKIIKYYHQILYRRKIK